MQGVCQSLKSLKSPHSLSTGLIKIRMFEHWLQCRSSHKFSLKNVQMFIWIHSWKVLANFEKNTYWRLSKILRHPVLVYFKLIQLRLDSVKNGRFFKWPFLSTARGTTKSFFRTVCSRVQLLPFFVQVTVVDGGN